MSTIIYGMLKEEKQRNLEMQETYTKEIDLLPKGSIISREIQGKKYYYLNYRSGSKTISEYIGKDELQIEQLRKKIARRKRLQATVKRLKIEYKEICKIVKE